MDRLQSDKRGDDREQDVPLLEAKRRRFHETFTAEPGILGFLNSCWRRIQIMRAESARAEGRSELAKDGNEHLAHAAAVKL